MDTTSLRWRDITLLLVAWGITTWTALNSLFADLAIPWSAPLLGFIPASRLAVIAWWGILAGIVTLGAGLVAAGKLVSGEQVQRLKRQAGAYLLLAAAFTLLAVYVPAIPAVHLGHALRLVQALALAGGLLWLFWRRDPVPLRPLVLTGTWAVLVVAARIAFPALPLDFAAAAGLPSTAGPRLTFAVGQVVQVVLVALPLALLVPALRRLGERLTTWAAGRPVWLHGLFLTLVVAARLVYQLSAYARLVTPLVVVQLLVMVGLLAAGLLALRAVGGSEQAAAGEEQPASREGWYWVGLLAILAVYVALAVPVCMNYLDEFTADAYAYFKIARDYAEGHPVVRGYWSPLMSWLMAPLVALGVLPQAAQRMIAVPAGALWVVGSVLLARRFELSRPFRLALAGMVALIAVQIIYDPTPDLLGTALLGLYFYLITDPRYLERPVRFGVLVGLVGGVAYFGKYYNLVFVFAHIVMTGVLLVLHGKPLRRVLPPVGVSLLAFLITVAPWVVLLSLRYGQFTVSTSGIINHAITGAGHYEFPCWVRYLWAKPSDVLFPWEDCLPEFHYNYDWSPFESIEYFYLQLQVIAQNLFAWSHKTILWFGFFAPAAVVTAALAVFVEWKNLSRRFMHSWIVLSIVLHIAGYATLLADLPRYYLIHYSLLAVSFFSFVEMAWRRLQPGLKGMASGRRAFVAGVLLVGPLLVSTNFETMTTLLSRENNPCQRVDSPAFAGYLVAPTAGADEGINTITYHTRVRSFGAVDAIVDDPPAVDASLHEHGVATFVTPSDLPLTGALVDDYGYEVVARLPLCGVEQTILRVP